jgi:hypothetical protein
MGGWAVCRRPEQRTRAVRNDVQRLHQTARPGGRNGKERAQDCQERHYRPSGSGHDTALGRREEGRTPCRRPPPALELLT